MRGRSARAAAGTRERRSCFGWRSNSAHHPARSEMAIMATLIGLIGRFTGKLLTMSLGWASVLLFGRVPRDREVYLAAITFGSILWSVLAIAMLIPGAGAWLLSFPPVPAHVDDSRIRLAMAALVIVIPPILGAATLRLVQPRDRPSSVLGVAAHLARG